MSDREFAEGCLAEIARLENKRKPEPDRAGAVGRELDVLERGRTILDDTIEGGISPTGRVREFVADAMAEIEELNVKYQELGQVLLVARDSVQELDATVVELREQLRAITEAEPETIARRFHETYERLAPEFGYETRKESAIAWENVPENDQALMIATVRALAVVAPKGDTEE